MPLRYTDESAEVIRTCLGFSPQNHFFASFQKIHGTLKNGYGNRQIINAEFNAISITFSITHNLHYVVSKNLRENRLFENFLFYCLLFAPQHKRIYIELCFTANRYRMLAFRKPF